MDSLLVRPLLRDQRHVLARVGRIPADTSDRPGHRHVERDRRLFLPRHRYRHCWPVHQEPLTHDLVDPVITRGAFASSGFCTFA